jgi:hypothetical protein
VAIKMDKKEKLKQYCKKLNALYQANVHDINIVKITDKEVAINDLIEDLETKIMKDYHHFDSSVGWYTFSMRGDYNPETLELKMTKWEDKMSRICFHNKGNMSEQMRLTRYTTNVYQSTVNVFIDAILVGIWNEMYKRKIYKFTDIGNKATNRFWEKVYEEDKEVYKKLFNDKSPSEIKAEAKKAIKMIKEYLYNINEKQEYEMYMLKNKIKESIAWYNQEIEKLAMKIYEETGNNNILQETYDEIEKEKRYKEMAR